MNEHDMLGYLASSLVLTTFWMRSMFGLRLVAIASNFAFIAYGAWVGIHPVLLLHLTLLPLNISRIAPELRRELGRIVDAVAARRTVAAQSASR